MLSWQPLQRPRARQSNCWSLAELLYGYQRRPLHSELRAGIEAALASASAAAAALLPLRGTIYLLICVASAGFREGFFTQGED